MKNLQELLLDESVLDDDMTDKMKEILLFKYPKEIPGCDAYGRTLEVGDWVFCVPTGQKGLPRQTFGIVAKITPKRLTICVGFDFDNMGFHRRRSSGGTSITPQEDLPKTMNISVPCSAVVKIIDKDEFLSTIHKCKHSNHI